MFSPLVLPWVTKTMYFPYALLSLCSRHIVSNMFGTSNRNKIAVTNCNTYRIVRIAIHIVSCLSILIITWGPWQFPDLVLLSLLSSAWHPYSQSPPRPPAQPDTSITLLITANRMNIISQSICNLLPSKPVKNMELPVNNSMKGSALRLMSVSVMKFLFRSLPENRSTFHVGKWNVLENVSVTQ